MTVAALYVDLDGTLIRSDLFVESALALICTRPLSIFRVFMWALRGRAFLKAKLAEAVTIDVAGLPYRAEFLAYLREQTDGGRQVVLATAANERLANAVARQLGFFSHVLASTASVNLKGATKLQAIVGHSAGEPFVYAGNDHADLAVWQRAAGAILVDTSDSTTAKARRVTQIEAEFPRSRRGLRVYLKSIRAYQWLKNVLLFVPLFTAHLWTDRQAVLLATLGFVAFSLAASSVYLLNDLADLSADRVHPRKRLRPIASGELPALQAILLVPVLLSFAVLLAWQVSLPFLMVLAAYWFISLCYTLGLKTYVLIDVIVLATLYTVRVIGGAVVIAVAPSFWLLAFSMCIFLSLALIKRCTELQILMELRRTTTSGRDYRVTDLAVLQGMGVAAGFTAVLVFALYINSDYVLSTYSYPQALWLLCGTILYWIARMWLKTARGDMRDDPLLYAVRDRASIVIILISAATVLAAT